MPSEGTALKLLNREITACQRCPRLRRHCEQVARTKRASFRTQQYFARPVPNFGDGDAKGIHLLIVGLAPGAHGANRTGRMFTGDRSGDFLFRALHETGFANQPASTAAGDGLMLRGALITAACHCAPPDNKPTIEELAACAPYLEQTFDALAELATVLCLGRIAMMEMLRMFKRRGWITRTGDFPFHHGASYRIQPPPPPGGGFNRPPFTLLCSYHPSQQNTFTGRLTAAMLRRVLEQALVRQAGLPDSPASA